ncbi:ABC transporter ATP-binding protein [Thermopolyspora flexuosa]|jgi:ABC-2 type transport system ATP-binding protein|uniref:ABC-2 type transport system ATP-binding protein n=1 Tax=Thermopolyspora flexuosa TaxID=103836 RepID=A0A543IYR0_9ACTN|nr:ABC transporter ATP-binding protein [Thermopolyspora flexuosa]TQM75712.1 ABC-2 type transport system ATP-binding protein [Thermopolyspora flexuosa]GGM61462.1 ABC transporter ATP-binding protein [Thermopolyspora flexuosa]
MKAPISGTGERAPAVQVIGLRKRYGDVHAVDQVNFSIAPGEIVALLGPNGAGKSTTMDMILGLTRPDDGEVRVFGLSPGEAVKEGRIGAMLQEGGLLDDATVAEIVGMVASLHRRPLSVREALRRAGIEDLAKRRSTRLSGGQKQRVRFAVALVSDPDLLLLDEPTAGMDVATRRDFWQAMGEFTASGRTVIFATHYLEEAEEYADRVIFLKRGRVVADGSVEQMRRLAAGRTVRAVIPGVTRDAVLGLPGVLNVEVRHDKVRIVSADSDATLHAMLPAFPQARGIEVSAVGLDEVFLAIAGGDGTATGETLAGERGWRR